MAKNASLLSPKKSAQDAHEAIRPTNMQHSPEVVEQYLTRKQFMLYQLIWKHFISSQMVPAVYDTLSTDIDAGNNIVVRATGSVMKFPGFLAAYEEKNDDDDKVEENKTLPNLMEGQLLKLLELSSEQAIARCSYLCAGPSLTHYHTLSFFLSILGNFLIYSQKL